MHLIITTLFIMSHPIFATDHIHTKSITTFPKSPSAHYASSITLYRTELHYRDTKYTSPCPILRRRVTGYPAISTDFVSHCFDSAH